MVPLAPSASVFDPALIGGLQAAGFTDQQAEAIAHAVDAATAEAVTTLRDELSRWHAYLAVYLLVQIGIALLAILLVQAIREPAPRSLVLARGERAGFVSGEPGGVCVLLRVRRHAVRWDREAYPVVSMLRLQQSSFGIVCQNDRCQSLQFRRGGIYQDPNGGRSSVIHDSTLQDRAFTVGIAATSERHHAPKLDCGRQRSESECAYPPSRPMFGLPPSARCRAIRRDITHSHSA
jgi:hypothetical protein